MNKRTILTTLLAGALTLNLSCAVLAAPASTNEVVTGRTIQNNQTGVIKPSEIQKPIYHNVTTEITLKGTIIIDGPELVFTAIDPDGSLVPSDKISVIKIADKTYTYSVSVNPSKWKGNVNFTFNAKTIYKNGKTAGQTHTSAPEQKQNIHVAYVSGFEYSNFTWGNYDRSQNQYAYSYNLVKVWDDGTKIPQTFTNVVSGTGEVSITGEDVTYDGRIANVGTEVPPVNILSFGTENIVWAYNEISKKYDLSFNLVKNLSNGKNEQQIISISDVAPSTDYTYAAKDTRSLDYVQNFNFIVPAAPVPVVPTATNISVNGISSLWTGNDANGGNIQEAYTLNYLINGKSYAVNLKNNFTKGTGFVAQELIYIASYEGQTVNVVYTLNCIEPSKDDTTNLNGNEKNK